MTYSCAIFSRGAQTLEEAQLTKLELVAKKLDLKPGMRLLDVGCGWGSFAIHAARNHGVKVTGVTISPAQAELARERVKAAGLEDEVEILVADYRQLPQGSFDAIASIGMAEHVGESQIDVYAKSLFSLLRPGGLLLNHAIAATDPDDQPLDDLFSTRYVFPDGEPLPLSRIQLALERAGFYTEHAEAFMEDYAITLEHWANRLEGRLERGRAAGGRRAHAGVAAVPARCGAWLCHRTDRRLSGPCAQATRGLEWRSCADVAQLARASPCHGEGRGFESLHPLSWKYLQISRRGGSARLVG